MKFKKTLKFVAPTVGVAALAVTLPLALTSCKSDDGQSININGTVLTSKSIEWTYSRDQTYWVNAKSSELPILNGNIYVGKDNSILNTKGVQVTYQWYKNAVPIQNEADANSSQYVVKTLEKYPSNYFCVARISYQGKQIVSTSPLFIVEPSPLFASIEYLNPTRKPKLLSSVDGFNSQLKAVATSTSTNFDLPSEIKKGNVQFQWMKKAILFGQDKIVGQQEVFSPSEPGIYYCNITVIKDGQAVTVKTKDEVVLPNTLVSTITSDNNTQTEKTSTAGNTFYLKADGQTTTLTASLDSYMGQTPATSESSPSSRSKRATLSGVYATMWLKKVDDAGGYASNDMLGNYEIIKPMSSENHSLQLGKNKTGDYLLVEAIYPQGTQPSDLTNYSNITGIKYTDVKVEPTRNIDTLIDKLSPTAVQKVADTIHEQTQVSNFLNTESVGYKNLVNSILKELGLTGKANVEFVVNNGDQENTNRTSDEGQTSTTNVTVSVKLKPANGYTFKESDKTTLGPWTTNIQKYQVLNNFASLVNSTDGSKKSSIEIALKNNLNQTNYSTWLSGVKENGSVYTQIVNQITGNSTGTVASKQEGNIPSNSFKMKISFINNGAPNNKENSATSSSDSPGNSSVKIVYTANPGFVFDNKGNTQLEYTYSNIANGFAIDPTNTTITSLLPKIGGLLDLGGIIEKLFPQITPYLGIINKVLQDPYIWGSNLGAEIVKLISGLGGKTTIEGDPVVAVSGKYKTFTYTFKTNNPNKWKFPSASKKDLNSDTTTITLQTKISKDKELPLNYTNGWISVPTISSSNETQPTNKESSTTLTANATIAAPSFLSSFLKLNFEWYQSSGSDGKQVENWTYVEENNGSNTLTISSPTPGTKYKCKIWLTVNGLPKLWIGHAVWSPEYTVPTSTDSGSGSGSGSTSSGSNGSSSSSKSTESHNQFFTTTNKFFKF